ncbi:hypothetical protein BDQ17DRAFT_1367291 [Cyathus striatus]|nr:hypothetical protein BDQ17DRAFT_1367291 [Cyathus striatus]
MSPNTPTDTYILSLPVEILGYIFKLQSTTDRLYSPKLKELCLVCKRFNKILLPNLFLCTIIKYKIAHNRIHYSWTWTPDYDSADESRKSTHRSSMWDLKRLLGPEEWSREYVISEITQMPSLTKLALNVDLEENISIQVHMLPLVKELSIRSLSDTATIAHNGSIQGVPELIAKSAHQLISLEICNSSCTNRKDNFEHDLPYLFSCIPKETPLHIQRLTLDGFYMQPSHALMPHLQSLDSFSLDDLVLDSKTLDSWGYHIAYHRNLSAATTAWKLFQQEKIYLQEIALDEPNESFLQYLRSYTRLKSLRITTAVCTTAPESEKLSTEFYMNTLCNHAKSLEVLEITPRYEDSWCYGEHIISSLMELSNLQHLSITIIADLSQMKPMYGYPDRVHYMFGYSTVNPSSYDSSHSVCQLMQTVILLPRLNLLSIHAASIAFNCFASGSINEVLVCAISTSAQIDKHVTSYGPLDPSKYKFTINHRHKCYRLQ